MQFYGTRIKNFILPNRAHPVPIQRPLSNNSVSSVYLIQIEISALGGRSNRHVVLKLLVAVILWVNLTCQAPGISFGRSLSLITRPRCLKCFRWSRPKTKLWEVSGEVSIVFCNAPSDVKSADIFFFFFFLRRKSKESKNSSQRYTLCLKIQKTI